jgi:hypothetical protein
MIASALRTIAASQLVPRLRLRRPSAPLRLLYRDGSCGDPHQRLGVPLEFGWCSPLGPMRAVLTVAAAALAAAGCDGSSEPSSQPVGFVSEATWTDGPWPFTVTDGVLMCHAPHRVTFTAKGVEYALNSAAKSTGQFQNVNPLVRDGGPGYVEINDTRVPVKQGLGPMIVRGLDLCP